MSCDYSIASESLVLVGGVPEVDRTWHACNVILIATTRKRKWSTSIKLFGFGSFQRDQNFIFTNTNHENRHVISNLATKTKIHKHGIQLLYRFLLFPMLSPPSAGPVIDQYNMQSYFNIIKTDMPNFSCCNLMTTFSSILASAHTWHVSILILDGWCWW